MRSRRQCLLIQWVFIMLSFFSMVPGVCAAAWSVFYFKEIRGQRNLRILVAAVLITLTGAAFVGISK